MNKIDRRVITAFLPHKQMSVFFVNNRAMSCYYTREQEQNGTGITVVSVRF